MLSVIAVDFLSTLFYTNISISIFKNYIFKGNYGLYFSQITQQECDYQTNLLTKKKKKNTKLPIDSGIIQMLQLDKSKIMELFIQNIMIPIELPINSHMNQINHLNTNNTNINININTEKKNRKKSKERSKERSKEPCKEPSKKLKLKKIEQNHLPKKLVIKNTPNVPTKKPKKPKKPKKLIIKKSYLHPTNFDTEYDYFIYMCKELKHDYYRYKTNLWDGPAMIIKENTNLCKKLKEKIDIDLNFDILINKSMAVYPRKYYDPNCISYTKEYVVCEDHNTKNTPEKIDVIEWIFNDRTYLVDTYSNSVYDPDTELQLGLRKYTEDQTWIIVNPN